MTMIFISDTKPKISIDLLHNRLDLKADEGLLFWRPRVVLSYRDKAWNTRYAGQRAFNASCGDYYKGSICSVQLMTHRVIFAMYYGYWPVTVDHINRDGKDNRIDNLRAASQSLNQQNIGPLKSNSSGKKGVTYNKRDKLWIAYIVFKGQRIDIGYFKTFEDAKEARVKKEIEFGFHPE